MATLLRVLLPVATLLVSMSPCCHAITLQHYDDQNRIHYHSRRILTSGLYHGLEEDASSVQNFILLIQSIE